MDKPEQTQLAAAPGPAPPAGPPANPPPVDVERLADRVYRLLLADLRLERARGAETRRRR